MNYGGDAADQVVRYYLEGMEYTLKLSGTAAKSHGLLYVPIRDKSDPDNIEIAIL